MWVRKDSLKTWPWNRDLNEMNARLATVGRKCSSQKKLPAQKS